MSNSNPASLPEPNRSAPKKTMWKAFSSNAACIAAIVSVSGCVLSPHSPRMTQAEVIRLSATAAAGAGFELSEFRAPEARFEVGERDRTWSVLYEGKDLMPGNHFLVVVEDRTGRTQVIPGR